jgi:glycosyltransferase involved in cell wall biosynthesis
MHPLVKRVGRRAKAILKRFIRPVRRFWQSPGALEVAFETTVRSPHAGPILSVYVDPRDFADVSAKLSRQTLRDVEVLQDEAARPRGRYSFRATRAFRDPGIPEVYLEEMVLALECEGLAFALATFPVEGSESLRAVPAHDGTIAEWTDDVCVVRSEHAVAGRPRMDSFRNASAARPIGRLIPQPAVLARGVTCDLGSLFGPDMVTHDALIVARGARRASIAATPVYEVRRERDVDGRPTVLVHLPFLAVGGAETLTLKTLEILSARFRFVVLTSEPASRRLGSFDAAFRRLTPLVYGLADFADRREYTWHAIHLARKFGAGVFFTANGSNWFYDELPALRAALDDVLFVNQVFDHRMGWIDRYCSATRELIDVHIAPNRAIEAAYINEYGIAPDRVHLIHHGIDLAEYDRARFSSDHVAALKERIGIPPGKVVVAFFARMHPQKRPFDFLEVARRLENAGRAHFLMVGDGPLGAAVEEWLRESPLRNVTKLPFYTPLAELVALADLLCVTSEYEGLPLVLLECLAMGVPAVSTDVGCIAEVLAEGNGRIVPVGDVDALTAAVRDLLDPGKLEAARRGARSVVERGFDIRAVAEAYGAVFQRADLPARVTKSRA